MSASIPGLATCAFDRGRWRIRVSVGWNPLRFPWRLTELFRTNHGWVGSASFGFGLATWFQRRSPSKHEVGMAYLRLPRRQVSRFALHTHRDVWPLLPIRLTWAHPSSYAEAGAVHWVLLSYVTDPRGHRVWMTVIHFGRLKVQLGPHVL